MYRDFKSLAEYFKNEPAFNRLREIVRANDVAEEFHLIFPDLEKIISDIKVDKKTLKLRVENAAWRSELKFRESDIVEKINKHYNEERIIHIRFTS